MKSLALVEQTGLLMLLSLLAGCAGSRCEEWATREVVNYNFCAIGDGSPSPGMVHTSQAGDCVAPGISARTYCVEEPQLDAEPVQH